MFDVGGRAERHSTPFYERDRLRAGDRVEGPAIVEQYDTTTVIPPGLAAEIDAHGNIVIDCTVASASAEERRAALATPILMRVIGGALASIAKEMAGVLYRMSYSSIIRESEDLGAGLFDRDGNKLAESDSTPMFMGAMPKIVKNVIRLLGDDIHDGDVILHNDPYVGATHSPDVAIVIPIFVDGELVGFSGASAHVLDIGGAYPGLAIDLVDNWSEGNIYRALKLQEKGVWQEALWKHILENVRTPSFNNGDIQAMIAACELARRRYLELLDRYGTETVLGAAQGWLEYSERMLRQEIAKVPDGRYETEVGLARRRRGPPRREAPRQGRGRDRRRRDHVRPHRLERRGADGLQLPVRGHDGLGDVVHHADDLPRRGDLPGLRAAERGDARAGQRGRAEGLDLQPELPARVLRALLPGAAGGRSRAPRARADHPRSR